MTIRNPTESGGMSEAELNVLVAHIINSNQPGSDPALRFRFQGQDAHHTVPIISLPPVTGAAKGKGKMKPHRPFKSASTIGTDDEDVEINGQTVSTKLRRLSAKHLGLEDGDDANKSDGSDEVLGDEYRLPSEEREQAEDDLQAEGMLHRRVITRPPPTSPGPDRSSSPNALTTSPAEASSPPETHPTSGLSRRESSSGLSTTTAAPIKEVPVAEAVPATRIVISLPAAEIRATIGYTNRVCSFFACGTSSLN